MNVKPEPDVPHANGHFVPTILMRTKSNKKYMISFDPIFLNRYLVLYGLMIIEIKSYYTESERNQIKNVIVEKTKGWRVPFTLDQLQDVDDTDLNTHFKSYIDSI